MGTDKDKMNEFVYKFENNIFPTIKGKDGEGVNRLKRAVEDKRKEVENRKQKRSKSN